MGDQAAWGRAIWAIRFKMVWYRFKSVLIELWDVFTAIFTIISAIAIAVLVWGPIIALAFKKFGILEW